MSAKVNHAITESLATMGLGHRVPFQWLPLPLNAVSAANCVELDALSLPALPTESEESRLFAGIGLALLGVQAHGSTDFAAWPSTGLRREALATMELGQAIGPLLQKMPFAKEKVEAFYLQMRDTLDLEASQTKRVLQCILLTSLELGLQPEQPFNWAQAPQEEQRLHEYLERMLPTCRSTQERVNFLSALIPESVPPVKQEAGEQQPSDDQEPGQEGEPGMGGQGDGQKSQAQGDAQNTSRGTEDTCDDEEAQAEKEESSVSNADSPADDIGGPSSSTADEEDMAGQHGNTIVNEPSDATQQCETEEGAQTEQVAEVNEPSEGGESAAIEEPTSSHAQLDEVAQEEGDGTSSGDGEEVLGAATLSAGSSPDDEPDEDVSLLLGKSGGYGFGSEAQGVCQDLLSSIDGQLTSALLRALQDTKRRKVQLAHSGSRIATGRFWRLNRLGDTRIYRKSQERSGLDIALQVMLDRSGSMKHDIGTAKAVTMALMVAMSRMMDVSAAVDIFPGYGRASTNIMPFGGRLESGRRSLQHVYASGGTPLLQALHEVVPVLQEQRRTRKVVLIITDGKPSHEDLTRAHIQTLNKQGVEVYAIGIRCEVGELIKASVTIGDVGQLPAAITQLFKRMLDKAPA